MPGKFVDVRTVLDPAARLHQPSPTRRSERAMHEIERFGFDLGARHRVVGRAAHGARAVCERAAITQRELDDRLSRRAGLGELLARHQLDQPAHSEHGRILHAGVVVHRMECQRARR